MDRIYRLVLGLCCVLFGLQARAQQTTIATSLPYGETLEFNVELADGQDSVYVDWGDGQRKSYKDAKQYWLTDTWVHGKLLGDTITMYGGIKRIDIDHDSVTVLQFANQPNLKKIYASHNKLTNDGLDLSGCPNVEILDLAYNNILNLNLLQFGSLQSFTVNHNPEFNTAVFASGNTNLVNIEMNDCDVVHFYPVKLPNLRSLNIMNGSLMDIDLADNYPNLQTLRLSGNTYLESVDLTSMPLLETISLSRTAVKDINISKNPNLTTIDVSHTGISKINMSSCRDLMSISATGCPISKLDVRGLKNLKYIYVDSTNISRLDLSDKMFVRNVNVRNTNIEFLDMHNGIGYNTLKSIDMRDCKNMTAQTLNFTFDAMPPHEGESWSKNVFIAGSNGEHSKTDMLEYDANNYYICDVEGDGTASMDSIAIVPQTVTGGTYTLEQEGTSTDKDAEGNYFPFRPISSSLNVMPGYPIEVKAVADEGYAFEGVEVNGKFYDDSLFVVSTAGATVKPIFKKDAEGGVIVLTVPTGAPQQYFLAADEPNTTITVDWGDGMPETYTLGTNHKAIVNENGTQGTTVTIKGAVTYADFSSYPGFGTDNQITAIDISKNENLRGLITYMNEIDTLDVSNQTNLEELDCSYCELDALDVSHNTKLTSLKAYGNYIDNIDVTLLPQLQELDLKGNMLETIDLSKNTKLVELSLQNNELKNVDVSMLPLLMELSLQGNKLTELNLSNNKLLDELNVSDNSLTSLDLSANTSLSSLIAGGNPLDMLDLSHNRMLNYINVSKNGWDACTLNDFYYLLPEYPADVQLGENEEKLRLRVIGNSSSTRPANQTSKAESVIATGKGWAIDQKGDGTGCDMAYVTLLPVENGTVTMQTADGVDVPSGTKVAKNTVVKVTATPASGYALASVKANGKVAANNQFTVTAATEVLVQFTISTRIEGVGTQTLSVESGKGELRFNTESSANVAVYTLSGAQVYAGTVSGSQAISLKPGVYVVTVGDVQRKMLVK